MIHSMSGGVIKDAGSYTFVKVRFDDDGIAWYITDFDVAARHTERRHAGNRSQSRIQRERTSRARSAEARKKAHMQIIKVFFA